MRNISGSTEDSRNSEENYGHAGKQFVEIIKELGEDEIRSIQKEFQKQLLNTDKLQVLWLSSHWRDRDYVCDCQSNCCKYYFKIAKDENDCAVTIF